MEILMNGIDVSKWQGTIDFQKVKDAGVQFVMMRDGFGRFSGQEDAFFERNYKEARRVGLLVGAYHYSYAKTPEEAREEARYCQSLLKGKKFEFPIAFDMEEKSVAALGKEKVSEIAKAFCEELERVGYYVCIYANKSWLLSNFTPDIFEKYDIWLAHWVNITDFSKPYGMWQYTSDGQVNGVNGRVDMDFAYKNYPNIMQVNGLNGYEKTPEPTPDFYAGKPVELRSAPLYASATAKKSVNHKTGTYYLYDGIEISGRYRITSTKERVLKKPIGQNVTGFVNASDLR